MRSRYKSQIKVEGELKALTSGRLPLWGTWVSEEAELVSLLVDVLVAKMRRVKDETRAVAGSGEYLMKTFQGHRVGRCWCSGGPSCQEEGRLKRGDVGKEGRGGGEHSSRAGGHRLMYGQRR